MAIKIKRFFSEPLIQFIILGGLLFLFVSYFQQKKDIEAREITVSKEKVNQIILNYKTQVGSLPSKQELEALIDGYIKEEISYREAKKLGLDHDDEIIRRRLSQKFDFLQTDLVEIKEPTEEDLLLFYNNHKKLFRKDATVTFSHIYFSADNSTAALAKERAIIVLKQLQNHEIANAHEKGDLFPLQYDYVDQAVVDVQQNFGNKPIVDFLFKEPLKRWLGPVESGYGWHLVFISSRGNTGIMPYKLIKEEVKLNYIDSVKATQNKIAYDKLAKKYLINRSYLDKK
ncbi:peptidyl-prolyl cis-trans isomerase [Flavobacterium pectinovorum]|uniref:Peptidyl-prolyl cis-trans isomerase n=1 Tax=Flavobacterium pectinovorum TaxID=29533 RepID=A0A502F7I0_9FLAO|nr:peptidylprolyl isomerase [Flavobacterium pectinovorum]TPG45326.1 peptidyl-prolyl cis-trans isomerase [Flavobacterium pectinovorum]